VNPGDIIYLRLRVVAADPDSPMGDTLRCEPIKAADGTVDAAGGIYAVNPAHCVTRDDLVRAVRKALAKQAAKR
jgi:hypothetical protein